jgi:type II secretory pathway pseudopilin PulG
MIALTIMGIMGTAAVRLFTTQSRFVDAERQRSAARSVPRGAARLLLSELRMVEQGGGVVAATASSVTLRVPYAAGLLCGNGVTGTAVSLLPADGAVPRTPSGFAWRDAAGAYTYTDAPTAVVGPGTSLVCPTVGITTLPNGTEIEVAPYLPGSVPAGTPMLVYQTLRYDIAPSTLFPGARGLWRTALPSGTPEEISAPLGEASRFKFYVAAVDTAVSAATPAAVVGLQLAITGVSERPASGRSAPETAMLATAIYFQNASR